MPEGLNDRISSIRVFGDASVVIFRDPDLRGRSTRVTEDADNLQTAGWNDAISSLEVRRDFNRMTRADVERELRRSPEFRNRRPPGV